MRIWGDAHPGVIGIRGWCASGGDAHLGVIGIRGWCASGGYAHPGDDAHPGVMRFRGWCASSRASHSRHLVLVTGCLFLILFQHNFLCKLTLRGSQLKRTPCKYRICVVYCCLFFITNQQTFPPIPFLQNSEDDHSVDDHQEEDDHTRGGEVLKYGT